MSTPAVFKGRLLRLATFLEHLPPERFDYGSWVGRPGNPWAGKEDLSCGTVACAFGWAATMPELRDAGLRLTILEDGYPRPFGGIVALDGDVVDHRSPERAGAQVFGLSKAEFEHLFVGEDLSDDDGRALLACAGELRDQDGADETGPGHVAEIIRTFVAWKYPEAAP